MPEGAGASEREGGEASTSSIHEYAREGKVLLLKAQLEHQPSLVNRKDGDGRTPLIWAISSGNLEAASEILKSVRDNKTRGFDIDESDDAGWTALQVAASIGSIDALKMLEPFEPEINAQSNAGQTALHFAASKGHLDVVQYLLAKGASPRIKDNMDKAPLHRAAAAGHIRVVQELMKARAPLNSTDRSGWTALHHAYAEGNGDVAVELLKAGADAHRTDGDGQKPKDVAVDDKVRHYVDTTLERG